MHDATFHMTIKPYNINKCINIVSSPSEHPNNEVSQFKNNKTWHACYFGNLNNKWTIKGIKSAWWLQNVAIVIELLSKFNNFSKKWATNCQI